MAIFQQNDGTVYKELCRKVYRDLLNIPNDRSRVFDIGIGGGDGVLDSYSEKRATMDITSVVRRR